MKTKKFLQKIFSQHIRTKRITFGSNGFKLRGQILFPVQATPESPVPGVVLCHGFGSGQSAVKSSAKLLAEQGVATMIFDLRGHCTSEGTVDGRMAEDVVDAWNVLKDFPEIVKNRMGLGGHSLGAMSTIMAAGKVEKPKVLFALCCPPQFKEGMFPNTRGFGKWGNSHNPIVEIPRQGAFPLVTGLAAVASRVFMYLFGYTVKVNVPAFFQNYLKLNMDEVVSRLDKCFKLFVFCEGDTITPYDKSVLVYEAACEPKVKIVARGGYHTTPLMGNNLRSQWINRVVAELNK